MVARPHHRSRTKDASAPPSTARSAFDESEQIGIEFLLMRICEAMRRAGIDDELCSLDKFRGRSAGGVNRHDLIVVTVDDESGHIDLS